MIYIDLILNLTLLAALSILSGFIEKKWPRHTTVGLVMQGILFGSAAVIGMLRPLNMGPGLIFDGRSVMVSMCALFFGPLAASIAAALTILCRIGLGGTGMLTGILVILSSAGIGLYGHFRLKPDTRPPSTARLYLFGLSVHMAMLALMFTMPGGAGKAIVLRIGVPVLLLYPLATILVGKILSDQISALQTIAQLEKSEALFRNLFEGHSAVKLVIDPVNGSIIDANAAAEKFYGWDKDHLLKMRVHDINTLPPDVLDDEIGRVRNLQKTHFEFQHKRRDGSICDVEVFSSKITIKGKDLLHSIIHDISERKRVENMLLKSEMKYRNLFENAPIGIFSISSAGESLSINSAMAQIIGYELPEDTIQDNSRLQASLFADPEMQNRFMEILREKNRVENFVSKGQKADGKSIWLNINARSVQQNGDDALVIEGFTSDITEQRKLEDQFRQAQKMESVGRLAGGVAHDYNNMLSVITGYAELTIESMEDDSPLRPNMEEILSAARRSTEITRQLLAFARRQTIRPRIIDLNETVENMLKIIHRLIGEDIDLLWKPVNDPWLVKMDPSQIDQILANLCVNARDAISGVGKLTIETGKATFDELYCADHAGFIPGEFVLLAVSDDGHGMEKPVQEMIFEPFFTTKDESRGTGLGLATVYGIVKQNNGFINVYSEPGRGTTFKIFLSRHDGEAKSFPAEETIATLQTGDETILVVEDEKSIREMTVKILENFGYRVLSAGNPQKALHLAKAHSGEIHLLITDVILPDMNGRALAEKLKTFHPNAKTLFMSGYTANVIAHHGVLYEGVNFIQKPFSPKELAVKTRASLGGMQPDHEGA